MLTFYPSSAICHGDRAAADLCRRGVAEADPGGAVPAITPGGERQRQLAGASASDVAEAIAALLETQLKRVDHMLYMGVHQLG